MLELELELGFELKLELELRIELELLEATELLDLTLLETTELLSDDLPVTALDDDDGGNSKLAELTSLEDAWELDTALEIASALEVLVDEELVAALLEATNDEDKADDIDDDILGTDAFDEDTEEGAGLLIGLALPPPPPQAVNARVSDRAVKALKVYKEKLSMIVLLGCVAKTINLPEMAAD